MADDELPPDDLELEVESDAGGDDDAPEQDESVDDQDSQDQDPKITEKRLKDTQAALTKKNQELSDFKSKFDSLNGKLELLLQQQQQKDKPADEKGEFDFLDNEDEQKALLDDPKNVALALKKVLAGLGKTLEKRDAFMLGEVKKMVSANTSDEGRAVSQVVSKLRQDADYQGFSDEQLAVMAKKQIAAKAKSKTTDNFKGSAGSRNGYRGGNVPADDDVEAESERIFKMLYPKGFKDSKDKE